MKCDLPGDHDCHPEKECCKCLTFKPQTEWISHQKMDKPALKFMIVYKCFYGYLSVANDCRPGIVMLRNTGSWMINLFRNRLFLQSDSKVSQ